MPSGLNSEEQRGIESVSMHVHLHSAIQRYVGQCVRNASPMAICGISIAQMGQSASFTTGAQAL